MHAALRQRVRVRLKRDLNPAPRDSGRASSGQTTGVGGKERGYDGAKKVKGRKRHLLVDTQGLVIEPGSTVHRSRTGRASSSCWTQTRAIVCPGRISHLWLDASLHRRRQGRGLGSGRF